MAFLEFRKFVFFDTQNNIDNGKIAECIQDTNVKVATSGKGHVVLCDVTGWAHLISHSWQITSFKAYELTISLAQQLPHDPYLVTVGDDEAGVNPLIKVWDWSRSDRHGNPTLARVSRAVPSHMRPTPATALAVHENKNLLAVGFQDGSVSLFRGEIARQRSGKMRTLPDSGNSPITGLAFKGADKLFVVSRASISVVWLTSERCVTLDEKGAAPLCSVLSDKHGLTVAHDDAIYCYTTEGRGPCYALEGEKVRLDWFRSYLIITTNETPYKTAASTSTAPAPKSHHKNLYDVAIRIASSQHYDVEGLTEIYKQYGDHLYSKGDLKGAIDHIWRNCNKKGYATEDHTTLLLTCYVKIDQHDHQGKLKDFINSKDKSIDFDVDVAIKVVRQVSIDDALSLAANHKRHDWYLTMMIENKKDFAKALDYIEDLEFEDADNYMKKYGHRLMQHVPEESTKFLKLLCTDYKPRSKPLVDESSLSGGFRQPDRSHPDDYIHIFLSNSERLIEFLEHMTQNNKECSKLVYDALIEHYIHVWAKSPQNKKKEYEEKVVRILRDPEANYDKDHMLIICQMLEFQAGVLFLYEENKLWRAQVALHLRNGDFESALAVCRRRGDMCPRLWLDVLWAPAPPHCLPELLNVIAKDKLLSPILVIDCLTSTPKYTLGDVRKYLTDVLKAESDVITREQQLSSKYREESERMKEQTTALQNNPIVFQSSRCAFRACNKPLELPTVHFFCQHSFHQYCFQTYSECEAECPLCAGARRRPDEPQHTAEALHHRLHHDHDP
ncbi:unnamed protein product [Arctia plantaginis]|uniref:PEP5/VPS11 N-terminal domain-containing protein n=1 Tax=Arctia plantaginis TaxID=874455 RepID=A0A8S1AJC2_ARCPL|nr:unnamed protein product [Arctia plantaginis]